MRVHLDTITNDQIRSVLGLKCDSHHEIEVPPQHILEAHFGEYSVLAKAYRTKGGPNKFFCNLACFLLEITYVHANAYGMPKKKGRIIIIAYIGRIFDWGSSLRKKSEHVFWLFRQGRSSCWETGPSGWGSDEPDRIDPV